MKQLPRIYIHIGTHKTGSTFIQRALEERKNKLLNEGILYVSKPSFYFKGLAKKNEYSSHLAKEIDSEIKNIVNKEKRLKKVIFSNEWFSGHYDYGYTNSHHVASILKDGFKDFEVSVIVYLRRQDDFIESIYTQLIHQGDSLSFDEYIESLQEGYFDWYRLLISYQKEFGYENIYPQVYHKSFFNKKRDLLVNFSDLIGSKVLKDVTLGGRTPNKGYSREALEIAYRLNFYLDKTTKKKLRKYLQENHSKSYNINYNYLSNIQRRNLLLKYEYSNKMLFDVFRSRLNASFFPIDNYDEWNEKLSTQKIIDIIGPFIKQELAIKKDFKTFMEKIKAKFKIKLQKCFRN